MDEYTEINKNYIIYKQDWRPDMPDYSHIICIGGVPITPAVSEKDAKVIIKWLSMAVHRGKLLKYLKIYCERWDRLYGNV